MPEGRTHKPVINPEQCETCDVCARGCPAVLIPEYRQETGSLGGPSLQARRLFNPSESVQFPPVRRHARSARMHGAISALSPKRDFSKPLT